MISIVVEYGIQNDDGAVWGVPDYVIKRLGQINNGKTAYDWAKTVANAEGGKVVSRVIETITSDWEEVNYV